MCGTRIRASRTNEEPTITTTTAKSTKDIASVAGGRERGDCKTGAHRASGRGKKSAFATLLDSALLIRRLKVKDDSLFRVAGKSSEAGEDEEGKASAPGIAVWGQAVADD